MQNKKQDLYILSAFIILLFCITNFGFFNYFYSGDGFNCFQWLRNIATGKSTFEGPTYEYVFANHSYLTVILLAPIIALFPYPLTIHYIGFFNYSASALLLYFIARRLLPEEKYRRLPLAIAIAYLFQPLSLDGMAGFMWSIFQPESLLPLLIMLLVWTFLTEKRKLFFLIAAIMILTKEEYIPTAFAIFAWMFISFKLDQKNKSLRWRDLIFLVLIFVLCSKISIDALMHYKQMNKHTIVGRNASFASLLNWHDLFSGQVFNFGVFANSLYAGFTGLVLLFPLILLKKWRAAVYLAISLFGFVYLRLVGDKLIYGNHMHIIENFAPGLSWANWARVIIPPAIALSMIVALRLAFKKESQVPMYKFLFYGIFISGFLMNVQYPPTLYKIATNQRKFPFPGGETEIAQREKIKSHFANETPETIIIIPNFNWEYFTYNMTFTQYNNDTLEGFEQTSEAEFFKRWISQAKYSIFSKSRISDKILAKFNEFEKIEETENYLLYKRNEEKFPAVKVETKFY